MFVWDHEVTVLRDHQHLLVAKNVETIHNIYVCIYDLNTHVSVGEAWILSESAKMSSFNKEDMIDLNNVRKQEQPRTQSFAVI